MIRNEANQKLTSIFYRYAIIEFSPILLLIFALTNNAFSMVPVAPSVELKEFKGLLDSDIPASAVRWETFGTPEYAGGVPGPTDYVTLVAEITLAHDWPIFATDNPVRGITITPEAARPWLSPGYKAMLTKYKNQQVGLPPEYGCSSYKARLRKSARLVHGFVCPGNAKLMLYLILREPS